MFEPTSRYDELEMATFTFSSGREVVYKRRRFLPPAAEGTLLAEHRVTQGERLDQITARYLEDPELFWRLCDGNNAMHPEELTAAVGKKVRIFLPDT
ncbi:hypothetical protein Dvar_22510 [Desulfosarcina variabilis str. Montpellier]|uniref:LysM domain-containing protein n=1 Tax=Desulfosarcina variabilis TaxID=2300 RepID=UPI003AFB3C09